MNQGDLLKIFSVKREEDIELVKDLLIEYADSLGFDLCFQNFEQELAELARFNQCEKIKLEKVSTAGFKVTLEHSLKELSYL